MIFNRLNQSLRLLSVAVIFISLASCGDSNDSTDEVAGNGGNNSGNNDADLAVAGTTPDTLMVSRDPAGTPVDIVQGVDYAQTQAFSSGSVFDAAFSGDTSYGNAFAVTTGDGYGAQVGQLAFETFTMTGFASAFATLQFKAKGLNHDLIRVKFIDDGGYIDVALNSNSYSTSLGDGWFQVAIPITEFTGVAPATGMLFETDNTAASSFTFYLTDIGFSGTGGGSTGSGGSSSSGLDIIDFESAGAAFSWNVFENDDNPALEIVANPVAGGINTAATVAKFTARVTGNPYAGAETGHGDIGPFRLDSSNSTVKIMVYKTVISDVGIKLVVPDGGALPELKVANTVVNEWEELTFDFSAYVGVAVYGSSDVDQIVVFPDFNARAGETISYFDNIRFEGDGSGGSGGSGSGGSGSSSALDSVDFESAGAAFSWNVFENDDNPALEIVANPVAGGINTAATVAKFTARVTGNPYAGAETGHGDIGPFRLDSSNSTVKIMVYKTVISDVGIKLVVPDGGALPELKVANTVVNEWEELTFDFSAYVGVAVYGSSDIDQIVVFPDFNARAGETISYFDNISFGP